MPTRDAELPTRAVPWVIFDADNTLWHVEDLYDRARAQLVSLLEKYGADPVATDRKQRDRDLQLYERFGYSPKRFETSFNETTYQLLPASTARYLEPAVRDIARSVFLSPARPDKDLPAALDRLAGTYGLAIVTAGDAAIQARRLREFPYTNRFAAVEIVAEKTGEIFDYFCRSNAVERLKSFVVGDSLRSDILPAIEAGLNAVWCHSPNWREHEIGRHVLPPSVAIANSLREAVDIIMEKSESRPVTSKENGHFGSAGF